MFCRLRILRVLKMIIASLFLIRETNLTCYVVPTHGLCRLLTLSSPSPWKPSRYELLCHMAQIQKPCTACMNRWSQSSGAWESDLPQLFVLCENMDACQVFTWKKKRYWCAKCTVMFQVQGGVRAFCRIHTRTLENWIFAAWLQWFFVE